MTLTIVITWQSALGCLIYVALNVAIWEWSANRRDANRKAA